MVKRYDVVILGGGAGGLTVASGAASLGAKVALIEKSDRLGGDCLHFGCVPSKALIEAANEINYSSVLSQYGFNVSGRATFDHVKERVKGAISTIQHHDSEDRFEKMGVDVFFGGGEFVDEHHYLLRGGQSLYGKRFVIATGSRPIVPPIKGIDNVQFETNETIFDLEDVPSKMIFIGGGPIGLELAQAFSRMGTETVVVDRSEDILSKEDGEIQKLATEFLQKDINFILGVDVKELKQEGATKTVIYEEQGVTKEISGDALFLGVGRAPNTDGFGLEEIGVKLDKRGHIQVNDKLQSSHSHIYGIGDTNGQFPFTHAAGMEGKLVVQNAVLGLGRKVSYKTFPWTTYTTPEIFHVGMTEEEAKDTGKEYNVYKSGLDDVDRFVAEHKTTGMVKIISDKKGYIIGAHAIGEGAGDWMQTVIFAMEQKKKVGDLSQMVYPYPNHAAAIQRAADQYWREKLFNGSIPKLTKKYIQWFR